MAAIISGDLLHAGTLARLRGGKLEAIKWTAFAFMLLDHFAAYAVGVIDPFAEFIGAMVFPMFAFALAVAIAQHGYEARQDLLGKMLGWAFLAQFAAWLVREPLPLNVLFTFAAALSFDLTRDKKLWPWERVAFVAVGLLLGYFGEFSFPGVGLVLALLWWARTGSLQALGVAALLLVMLYPPNRSWGALLAPAAVAALVWCEAELPRARGVFYVAYTAQFAAFAVVAAVLR